MRITAWNGAAERPYSTVPAKWLLLRADTREMRRASRRDGSRILGTHNTRLGTIITMPPFPIMSSSLRGRAKCCPTAVSQLA